MKENTKQVTPCHPKNVAEKLAKEYNVSSRTIKRCGKLAGKFHELEIRFPEIAKEMYVSGKIRLKEIEKLLSKN
jgi:hypothetical protein